MRQSPVQVWFGRQARNVFQEARAQVKADSSVTSWQAMDRDPTPAEAAALTELVERLLASLSERDRRIVVMSLEGKTVTEICDAFLKTTELHRAGADRPIC
jgi:DNA-directed RNA polymerase specialized sigma24 family protein